MTFSLYAATVPTCLQMLGAVSGLLDKAEAWCADRGTAPADLLGRKLAPDMYPLSYQVKSAAVHSQGAIEGVLKGGFSPDTSDLPESFAPLKARIAGAIAALEGLEPAVLEAVIGRDMAFVFGEHRIAYLAEDFVLGFSQPNFYFHCTAAYAILRAEGLPIGKRDFLGHQRRKPKPALGA
jgi:hypothetical protein